MTTTCRTCNKSVDPLRSRFVGVQSGKVVAYCSAACAAQAQHAPTPAAVPITIDSGPVIQIVYEPSSGVVTGAPGERTEPRAKHPDEIPIAAFWSADKETSGAARTASDPGSGPVQATSSEGGADDDVAPPRKRRASLALLLVVLLAAAGFLAYQYLVKHSVAAATKVLPAPTAQASLAEPVRPPAVDVAPAIDVDASIEQARATLQAELAATSPRLSRIAAAALARTQDRAACAALASQLGLAGVRGAGPRAGASDGSAAPPPAWPPETSDIARLDLAYSLARGGDKRGSDALATALGAQRADVRDEAARLLALLGDRRAVPHLIDVLAVSQRRLGAAEHLAHLAEPHAIKVLEALRGDARTSADDKARATIALGFAGRGDVGPALRDMLGDPHFNAFAAAALAELKDGAARPVLEQQLASPALRVRAARALRRLDPALDPKPLLPDLLPILKTGRDTDQVHAAEAILLLAGPERWSAYD